MTDQDDSELLDPDGWDTSLSTVLGDMHDRPLNVHKLLANNPELLEAWWPLRMYITAGASLGQRRAELVILRTAAHRRQWYEWASHADRGLTCGLSIDEINRVIDGPEAMGWSEPEALLLRAVDDLERSGVLSRNTRGAMLNRFDKRQVFDVIAIYSTYVMLAAVLDTWDVELDQHVLAAIADSVNEQTFRKRLEKSL